MTDKSLTLASIAAAGTASLCCIGPLAAAGLGLSSFGAAAWFEGLRPYLLGITVVLLAGAFYLNYGKRRKADCADSPCAVSPEKMRKQTLLLWLTTGVVAILVSFPYYFGLLSAGTASAHASVAASGDGDDAFAVFAVNGMTCEGCALGMKATLEREKGVKSAEVDYETETARIHFSASQTSPQRLIDAIDELGYGAQLKEPQS